MLELHSLSCFYTKRIEEGSQVYWMMRGQLQALGEGYLPEDAMKRVINNEMYFPATHAIAPTIPPLKNTTRPGFRQSNTKKGKNR
jgi:hypothetical protein